jgi:hypothetical protein
MEQHTQATDIHAGITGILEEITIHVFRDSAGDFQYGIYKGSPEEAAENESIDGGACTTTMQNALGMAVAQAKELINI